MASRSVKWEYKSYKLKRSICLSPNNEFVALLSIFLLGSEGPFFSLESDKSVCVPAILGASFDKCSLQLTQVDMKTEDEVDQSKTRVVFRCNALEKTWANQRRKRREKLRHSTLHESVHPSRNDTDRQQEEEESISGTENDTGTKAVDPSSFSGDFEGSEVCCIESTSNNNTSQQGDTDPRPLVSFIVRVGTGEEVGGDLPSESVVLEMTWIDGHNKNDLYQLFQFFQNKLSES